MRFDRWRIWRRIQAQRRLNRVAEEILEARPIRPTPLTLVNEIDQQYTVVSLPVGWRVTDQKPFNLQQSGYEFLSKWQAGVCPQEVA